MTAPRYPSDVERDTRLLFTGEVGSSMSNLDARAETFNTLLDDVNRIARSQDLKGVIEAALTPGQLDGSPDRVQRMADQYASAALASDAAHRDLTRVLSQLQEAWSGIAADTAHGALKALEKDAQHAHEQFEAISTTLQAWAEGLRTAQNADLEGVALLQKARRDVAQIPIVMSLCEIWDGDIHTNVFAGCSARLEATRRYQAAVYNVTRSLNMLTTHLNEDSSPRVNPHLVATHVTDLLTPAVYAKASQSLDSMSPTDRAKFWSLVSQAKSSLEEAYLWKALGAGYSVSDVLIFGQEIHPYGDNVHDLDKYLTPHIDNPDTRPKLTSQAESSYGGEAVVVYPKNAHVRMYDEWPKPFCAAGSIVAARLAYDPVLMFATATGKGPAAWSVSGVKAGDASPAAFRIRLADMVARVNEAAENIDHRNRIRYEDGGINPQGGDTAEATKFFNGAYHYRYETLDTPEERDHALSELHQVVGDGKPAFVIIGGNPEMANHQLAVVGQVPGMLEYSDPRGVSQWELDDRARDNSLKLGAIAHPHVLADHHGPSPNAVAVILPQ